MKVFQNNVELFPAQFKGCFISSGKVKLINGESDIKEYLISEVQIIDNSSQTIINKLQRENQKLKGDVRDLLQVCEENGVDVEDDNGNTVVNGRQNRNNHHHTEEVIYEDRNDGVTGFCYGVALGALSF